MMSSLSRWTIPLSLSMGIHLALFGLFFYMLKPIPHPLETKPVEEFIITSVESLPVAAKAPLPQPIEERIKEELVVVPPKEEVKIKKSEVPKKVALKPVPSQESSPLLKSEAFSQTHTETLPSAPVNTVEEGVSKPSLPQQSHTDSEEIQRYLAQVKQKVQRHLEYPSQAKKMRLEGETILKFSIFANGSLNEISIEIVQSSGKKILDDEAIVALKEAAPFASPPKESMTLSVPVSFKLKS